MPPGRKKKPKRVDLAEHMKRYNRLVVLALGLVFIFIAFTGLVGIGVTLSGSPVSPELEGESRVRIVKGIVKYSLPLLALPAGVALLMQAIRKKD
jgi:hypothetical protein